MPASPGVSGGSSGGGGGVTAAQVSNRVSEHLVGLRIESGRLIAPRDDGDNTIDLELPTGTAVADGVIVTASLNPETRNVAIDTSTGDRINLDLAALARVVDLPTPQTGDEIVALLVALTGTAKLPYSAITGGPPALANQNVGVEYTQAEKDKLGDVETDATADQTGGEIVTRLEDLTGTDKLQASAIRDLPTGGGGGGTITDDAFDLSDIPNESQTAGASRQAIAEMADGLLGNTDTPLPAVSQRSFNDLGDGVSLGPYTWNEAAAVPLATLASDTTITGSFLQGVIEVRDNGFTSPGPLGARARIFNGTTHLQTVHFSNEEYESGVSKAFKVPLQAITDPNYTYVVGVQGAGSYSVITSADSIILHRGDGPLSADVRAEVSRDIAPVQERVGGSYAGSRRSGNTITFDKNDGSQDTLELPASTGGGITAVVSDGSLTGDGITGAPLSVAEAYTAEERQKLASVFAGANPNVGQEFTQVEKDKLRDVEADATADQTGGEIVTRLEDLTGTDRLRASAIRDLPTGGEQGIPGPVGPAGGGITSHLVGSGNFDVSVNSFWAIEADSADITIDGSDWFRVSTGGRSEGGNVGVYHEIDGDEWRALTPANYGDRATNFIILEGVNTSGEAYLGRTADNKVLFSAQASSVNAYPLTVRGYNEGGTEGPAGPRGIAGPAGPAGASASDSRVEIHRGTLTMEEGRVSGWRWRGIVEPAVCPESGILRFHLFNGGTVNTLSSEISADEIRELTPISLGSITAPTAVNAKSVRASGGLVSNATRMIAVARTAENHLLFMQWQGTEFRNVDVIVYQHGAPQEEVASDNYDVITPENSASEVRADVPPTIRSVFNIGFPNVTSPAGNTLLVNLSVGTRSNTLQGVEIELWVNGAALPDVAVPEGGSAVDFELDDSRRTGTTWIIEARTTTSTGGQLENLAWTYEVVRFKNDYEILTDWTHVDTVLRQEISNNGFWRTLTNRPFILEDYSYVVVEARDARSNGISIERHWLYTEDLIPHLVSSPPSGIHSPGAHSALLNDTGGSSLISQFSARTRPSTLARNTFFFATAAEDGPVTEIRGVDGVGGLHQVASFGDLSIRIRARRKGT